MSRDTVSELLTSIRNAVAVSKRSTLATYSGLNVRILEVLKLEGFIRSYEVLTDDKGHKLLKVLLKYVNGFSAISEIKRISKQGRRVYKGADEFGKVKGGLGAYVVSTSKGVMTSKQARAYKEGEKLSPMGGEVICSVW